MTVTRVATILTIVGLLIPADLSAQRLPVPGTRRGPTRPAPLPPQPEPIARNLAYKRLRLSVESYPLVSYVRSPGFTADGVVPGWTSFGNGTRAEYRLTRHVAATLDLTSSFAGGPADVHTMELGTRLRPERSERRAYPFVDLRAGYVLSHGGSFDPFGSGYAYPTPDGSAAFRYGDGFGALGGVGMEYTLTRTLSLTTAAAVMRNRMTAHTLAGSRASERTYDMTLYRYTLGIRWNPVRVIRPPGT